MESALTTSTIEAYGSDNRRMEMRKIGTINLRNIIEIYLKELFENRKYKKLYIKCRS